MRTAVVGHVEYLEFVRVERVPEPGEIIHAEEWWTEPAGGGPDAAAQLHKLSGDCLFFTALGDDELGRRAHEELSDMGLHVEAAFRPEPTRRAFCYVDHDGERTITVMGSRLAPWGTDALPWNELDGVDGVYFTAGDIEALRKARSARVLVATSRVLPLLREAGVHLDCLVGSDADPAEAYRHGDIEPVPDLVVRTMGPKGGTYSLSGGVAHSFSPASLPGPVVDHYGAGDSFAAGLAYALALGKDAPDAVAMASRCAASVLTGRGPFEGQLYGDALL